MAREEGRGTIASMFPERVHPKRKEEPKKKRKKEFEGKGILEKMTRHRRRIEELSR